MIAPCSTMRPRAWSACCAGRRRRRASRLSRPRRAAWAVGEGTRVGTAMRNYRHIEVRPIAGALGAEFHGVDMSRDLDDDVVGEVRQAFLDHLVIFLRDQKVTPQQQGRLRPPVRRADRVSAAQGAARSADDHAGRQARARAQQLRRHLALRHDLSRDAADGQHAAGPRGAALRRRHRCSPTSTSPTRRCRTG